MRIDVYLVEKGLAESRNRAARLISEGKVLLDGKVVTKASETVNEQECRATVTEREKYVSRGGLKLEAALKTFEIDVNGKRCVDIGASTGGFTDCLLQNGAAHVLALDSGRSQLHKSIESDSRVTSVEGQNARFLSSDEFGIFDVAVMDVSFISQTLIHPALSNVINDGGIFISLIKPQFESGKSAIGKNGIVKSARDRENAIMRVLESANICGFYTVGVIRSPIDGGDGNKEYLACFVKGRTADTASGRGTPYDLKKLCM